MAVTGEDANALEQAALDNHLQSQRHQTQHKSDCAESLSRSPLASPNQKKNTEKKHQGH